LLAADAVAAVQLATGAFNWSVLLVQVVAVQLLPEVAATVPGVQLATGVGPVVAVRHWTCLPVLSKAPAGVVAVQLPAGIQAGVGLAGVSAGVVTLTVRQSRTVATVYGEAAEGATLVQVLAARSAHGVNTEYWHLVPVVMVHVPAPELSLSVQLLELLQALQLYPQLTVALGVQLPVELFQPLKAAFTGQAVTTWPLASAVLAPAALKLMVQVGG